VTAPKLLLRAVLDRFELTPRKPDGRAKTSTLTLEISVCDVRTINLVCTLLKPQHTTDHDPLGNTQTFAAQLGYRTRKSLDIDFLSLVKVAREKTNNRIERFLLVIAVRNHSQVCATTGSERQYA